MPSLDSYRKQAKQLVRWHREREWTVAQIIREHGPRFAKRSDRQILEAPFKLADAQEVVARKAGFASWAELKTKTKTETETKPETKAKNAPQPGALASTEQCLRVALAHVFVTDIERACTFYRDKLGFRVVFTYGQPPFFGEVARDGARFFLRQVDQPPVDPALRRKESLYSVAIVVESRAQLKQVYADFRAAGAPIQQALKKHPWGDWEFLVTDPDGNLLSFASGSGT
jgi:catechol 2,3-dioxygenase-like lactoylglutathione lyase family enzyme